MNKHERLKEVVGALKFYSKLRQKEVANAVGTSPTYLSDMMNGGVDVSDSFVERLCSSFPVVNKDYILNGVGNPLFRVEGAISESKSTEQSSVSVVRDEANLTSDSPSVTIPSSAWKVIELQAASLAEKDRQASLCLEMMEEKDRNTSRCIAMLEQSFELIKRGSVRVADATSADAATSEVG